MAKETLRLGVIGVGNRGGQLAFLAHRPEEGVCVVAGADNDDRALDQCRQTFGPEVFVTKDYRQLLDRRDIGAVFITTPDYLHQTHAVAALQAGKDVYLEKPMAITIEGCLEILRAARDNKRKLYLGHNMRHMPFVCKMRELIDSGAIGLVKAVWCRHFCSYGGDVYFKDYHAERAKCTSLLVQKAVHDIDVMHWLSGGYSQRVNAMGALTLYDQITDRRHPEDKPDVTWRKENWPPLSQTGLNPVIDVEDLSMMLMKLDNGVLASYEQCHYTPDGWRNYMFIGTEGRIENFGEAPGHCVVRLWNRCSDYNPYGDEQYFMPPVQGTYGGADPRIIDEFLHYLREDKKITTSAVAAYYSVAAACAATESLRNDSLSMEVPKLPADLAETFLADVA